MRTERLETRRLLAASLEASVDKIGQDFETDPRLIAMFHGPLLPGQAVPPIQAVAELVEEPDGDFPTGLDEPNDDPLEAPPFPIEDTFKLHSRPDSNFTIYLDFDGHVTEGTTWNNAYGIDSIVHPNYWGGTETTFSNSRLELIQEIWQVVAEDFAPFDVNVTTEEPTDLDDLRKNGNDDTRWGTRSVMTKDTFASCGCGGHAYLGSFDDAQDEPAFVYNGGLNAGSETVSHEVGHQLGLSHDGRGSTEYYSGHGSGVTGWGPIMGAPFGKRTTHWNNGDYFDASNTSQDDLSVITGSANFPYAPDDHGNDLASATQLQEVNTSDIDGFGIIETNDDVDWFKFTTGEGNVSLDISVLGYKPNLDVWAGLFDSSGTFIADSNPQDSLSASFTDVPLTAGEYFIKIDGVARDGTYDPALDEYVEPDPPPYTVSSPQGYSDYGSLGQYRIMGSVIAPVSETVSIVADTDVVLEGNSASFTLTTSDGGDMDVVVAIQNRRQLGPGLQAPNSTEEADFSGPLTQTVSIVGGSATIQVPLIDDGLIEPTEHFQIAIIDSGTYTVAERVAYASVEESQTSYGIFSIETQASEGDAAVGSSHEFSIRRFGREDVAHTVGWQRVLGTASNDDFVTVDSGTIDFAADDLSKPLIIDIAGDIAVEGNEDYSIEITIPTGETFLLETGRESADGSILEDESTINLASTAQFRLRQVRYSNGNFDHWAFDNFVITSTTIDEDFDPDTDPAHWASIERAVPNTTFPDSDGNSLFFNGRDGVRAATTVPVSPAIGSQVQFDLIFADANGNGLNATEGGEDAILEYSLDGNEWIVIETYDESAYTSWTSITTDLPETATFAATEFDETDTGTNTQTISISRGGFIDKAITLDWTIQGAGTNPVDENDFVGGLPSGTVSFAAGAESMDINVPVAGDYTIEPDETFELVLQNNSGGPIFNNTMQGNIVDDDLLGNDFGDAPSSFPVTLADDGARHDTSGPRLGASRDGDLDGTASSESDGDGADDDGVIFYPIGVDSANASLQVNLQEATEARVDAWVDFDGNGTWESDEKIIDNVLVNEGDTALTYIVAADAILGETFARVRVSSVGGLAPTGFATDGEVEDYKAEIVTTPLVESVIVNDGSNSRGAITHVTVNFDSEVEIGTNAFLLKHISSDTTVDTVSVSSSVTDGKTTSVLTFDPGAMVVTRESGLHSLIDGNYQLQINSEEIAKVGNGPLMTEIFQFGDEPTDAFFRFFGDSDADRDVDLEDLDNFGSAYRTSLGDAAFNDVHDFDGDGDVDIQDLAEFGDRFRTSL